MNDLTPTKMILADEGIGGVNEVSWTPPADMTFDEWQAFGRTLLTIQQGLNWWIGDWVIAGEFKWGEMYAQAMDITEWSYDQLAKAKWVCSKVEKHVRPLAKSWSHAVAVAHLQPAEQIRWLRSAQEKGWGSRELRELCRSGVDPSQATIKLLDEPVSQREDDVDLKELAKTLRDNPDLRLDTDLSDLNLRSNGKMPDNSTISLLEEQFLANYRNLGATHAPLAQYQFTPDRNWRFDFAWPPAMIAVEIQGGQYVKRVTKDGEFMGYGGGHHSPEGYREDVEKLNAATLDGWRVYLFTSEMVQDSRAVLEIIQLVDQSWGIWTKLREQGIYSTEEALLILIHQLKGKSS